MIRRYGVALAAAVVLPVVCAAFGKAQGPGDFEDANAQVVRLAPERFPQLPAAIRHDLERRGCTIPQVNDPGGWPETRPHNVIKGSFIQRGEVDWAVLCSVKRISSILIFREAAAKQVMAFGSEPDLDSLQGTGNGQIGYSRAITGETAKSILKDCVTFGCQNPPPRLEHAGINEALAGKSSPASGTR